MGGHNQSRVFYQRAGRFYAVSHNALFWMGIFLESSEYKFLILFTKNYYSITIRVRMQNWCSIDNSKYLFL